MQTLITVGIILLVFALITAILILMMKTMTQQSQLEYELRRDRITIPGQVTGRYEHVYYTRSGKQIDYMLKYSYLYDGVSYEREARLLEKDYETHCEGTEISVVCHPHHPKLAYPLINGRLNGIIAF